MGSDFDMSFILTCEATRFHIAIWNLTNLKSYLAAAFLGVKYILQPVAFFFTLRLYCACVCIVGTGAHLESWRSRLGLLTIAIKKTRGARKRTHTKSYP